MDNNGKVTVTIDKKDLYDLMKDFKRYYDGYTRHNNFAKDNILRFYGQIEDTIYGKRVTASWS